MVLVGASLSSFAEELVEVREGPAGSLGFFFLAMAILLSKVLCWASRGSPDVAKETFCSPGSGEIFWLSILKKFRVGAGE